MDKKEIAAIIESGKSALGIELGSTRIKAVLIDTEHNPIASGDFEWENSYVDGHWTYDLAEVKVGLQAAYKSLKKDIKEKYGVTLKKPVAMGISAMMHGYLAFDKDDNLLVPFRTWRDTTSAQAAAELTELLNFNIPIRWSVSHMYQSMLNGEPHIEKLDKVYTLSAYVNHLLTGEQSVGIGDASGMFPIDSSTCDYDAAMLAKLEEHVAKKGFKVNKKVGDILPKVLVAGENAGYLTKDGADLLDPEGDLESGIPMAPPEGDAGTGMVATNSVRVRTGNISAGTSIFAMVVTERPLKKVHTEVDMVTTPYGDAVAMVHANNCTSDINAWMGLFKEVLNTMGHEVNTGDLYTKLFETALSADPDCGGILSYCFLSGEPIMGVEEGRPLVTRSANTSWNLANFMRSLISTTYGTIIYGMEILTKEEGVAIDSVLGHGGIFRTEKVAQSILANALKAPVSVMTTAGEGGPWGMAILAAYMANKKDGEILADYLSDKVFASSDIKTIEPDEEGMKGYEKFMEMYKDGIKGAVELGKVKM